MKSSLKVAGYGKFPESDQFYLIVKDKVAKSAAMRLKADKTGTIPLAKGLTSEEIKKEFPVGKDITTFASWGKELTSEYGGVFEVVVAGEEPETEE